MRFQSHNGKQFNCADYNVLKNLELSSSTYFICIEVVDDLGDISKLYVVNSEDSVEKALSTAKRFTKKYRVSSIIKYVERESVDKILEETLFTIYAPKKNHYRIRIECYDSDLEIKLHNQNNQNNKQERHDEDLNDTYKRYINDVLNS